MLFFVNLERIVRALTSGNEETTFFQSGNVSQSKSLRQETKQIIAVGRKLTKFVIIYELNSNLNFADTGSAKFKFKFNSYYAL